MWMSWISLEVQILVLSSVQQHDEKQIIVLIYSHFCFSEGVEVVVLVAVEAVQEAPQTPEDVKGWFWSYFTLLKKEPIKPQKQAYILVNLIPVYGSFFYNP